MATWQIYGAIVQVAKQRLTDPHRRLHYLDVGAGRGELLGLLQAEFSVNARACDYHIDLFERKGVPIDKIDLNLEDLPYANDSFDVITCSEVVEHLENYRRLLREIHRVLKPGGLVIVTTPNVLNMRSRLRYFGSGFYNLFGPLPLKNGRLDSTDSHITPIPYFYLAHALRDSDFTDVRLDIDKRQKSSSLWLVVFSPILTVGWLLFLRSEHLKFKKITNTNKEYVYKHLSLNVLTGRTIIVSAIKGSTPNRPIRPTTLPHGDSG